MKTETIATVGLPFVNYPMQAAFPLWHTAGLLTMLAVLVGLSMRLHNAGSVAGGAHRIVGYAIILVAEWAMAGWIAWGCDRQGQSVKGLLGNFALGWRAIFRDAGLAVGFLVVANILLSLVRHLFPAGSSEGIKNLLPHTGLESVIFLGLCVTAATCEELIYRGYLQRQFAAWTGSAAAAIVLQGIVFGFSHAYQGIAQVVTIAVYGCLFGLFALWRKSLRPGMLAHFLQDGIGGLILARMLVK
jgi:hypothetical protein